MSGAASLCGLRKVLTPMMGFEPSCFFVLVEHGFFLNLAALVACFHRAEHADVTIGSREP